MNHTFHIIEAFNKFIGQRHKIYRKTSCIFYSVWFYASRFVKGKVSVDAFSYIIQVTTYKIESNCFWRYFCWMAQVIY